MADMNVWYSIIGLVLIVGVFLLVVDSAQSGFSACLANCSCTDEECYSRCYTVVNVVPLSFIWVILIAIIFSVLLEVVLVLVDELRGRFFKKK